MKKLIVITCSCLILSLCSKAQFEKPVQKKSTTAGTVIIAKPAEQEMVKKTNVQPLPDLKISAFNVKYISSETVDGIAKHFLEITYTIKNEGTKEIAAKAVVVQGYIGYDQAFPNAVAAGGRIVSSLASDIIAPGGSFPGSLRCSPSFDKNSHPFYTLYVDMNNYIPELNEQNNSAQMTILF